MTETFSVNFGGAKRPEFKVPDEGTYTFVIVEYGLKEANNEESRSKGINVAMKLKIVDDEEFNDSPMWHNLWVHYENPWVAKLFYDALTGRDTSDWTLENIKEVDYFIGERVGCAVVHEEYQSNKGETRTKLVPAGADAWYSTQF
jgi:hypothetical protein